MRTLIVITAYNEQDNIVNLVKEIKKYDSDVKVLANGKQADGKKLMSLMQLGVKQGNEIEVQVSGGDEAANADALLAFLQANL